MKSEGLTILSQSTKESTIQHPEKNVISNNNEESFKVYIRIRPHIHKLIPTSKNSVKQIISPKNNKNKKNNCAEKNMIKVDKNMIFLEEMKNTKNKNSIKSYIYDNIFNESATNEIVFNGAIKSMLDQIILGYNSTVLAYGVTGTGKTYTIFGDLNNNFKDEGIIFKSCDYLFEKIDQNKNKDINTNYSIKISYIEIYNEIVKDLISENTPSLMIVEDPVKGVICSNVKEIIIYDSVQLKKIINDSNKRRTMASTDQNQFSSRSHAILQMSLEKKIKKDENNYDIIYSKFLVVDLAGSEKGMEKGKRREEGVNINKSLFTLGNCLNILSEKSNAGKFVPYRDSKLTRILKDSLGGNILTVMLACISPCSNNYDDTLNTLNYAFKAKKITKKVMKNIQEININNLHYQDMIDNLKNEILQLKQIIKNQEIKLKQKVDTDNNKENIELNIKETKNNFQLIDGLGESEKYFGSIEHNNMINSIDIVNNKSFDNEQMTISLTERREKNDYNILNIDNIDSINIDIYNKYIEDIINNEINIDILKDQIESIKNDKNIIEVYMLKENSEDKGVLNKYNSIKRIYDKYIELVNEKLVENIEQNMIYNYNIKEIEELNLANSNKIKELEIQMQSGEKNQKISEEINYMKKNIIENNSQKEQIYQNIQKNQEQKDELKKILLNLFENKTNNSDKFIHIIHEKDKLSKITKQYKEEIDNYVKLQKQKDEDMIKINRKIEILRAKLKEKDKKICELEKKGGRVKYENTNIKLYNNKKINQNSLKENSKNKIKRKMVASPINKEKNSFNSSKRISFNISEDKNNKNDKRSKNKKMLKIFLNNENNKIKKYQKNILKYQTEDKSNEINKKNKLNENDLHKYKELIIPTTTITLTENNNLVEKENINPLYIKIPKINKWKKTPNNNINKTKKLSLITNPNNKKNNNINNLVIFPKNKKKQSVKSIKINLIENNNKYYSNSFIKSDSCEKNNKNNIKIDIANLNNIKEFRAEKINIDLTELDEKNIGQNIIEKKAAIKYLNLQNEKIIKSVKNISKSNPKSPRIGRINNFNKRLSLQEARLENKLKYEKNSNPKNELINAESFINAYKIIKSKTKKYNDDKKSVNTEPNNDSQFDKESKCSYFSNYQIYRYKTLNEKNESSLKNNRRDKNNKIQ